MKKILFLIFLLLSLFSKLLATEVSKDGRGLIAFELFDETVVHEEGADEGYFKDVNVSFSFFKTLDKNIMMSNIKNHVEAFKPLIKNERFYEQNKTLWLRVDLGNNFPSGEFVVTYGDMGILEHSFRLTQGVDIFSIGGVQQIKFSYNSLKDASVYYFKLSSGKYENAYRFLEITTKKNYYKGLGDMMVVFVALGMIMGLIFMAGLYNGAMYYYNRDKSFLYYMFMQFSITVVLFNMIGIISFTDLPIARSETFYSLCSLFAVFFTSLFTQSFLDTKIHLPKFNKILNIYISY